MTIVNALNRTGIARGGCILLACVAVTFEGGCTARVYADGDAAYPAAGGDDAVVYVDTVPPNIEAYPHYYYGDGYAYYVDGRWYRRGARGWGYYRQEPPMLQRQRGYVQRAPEARGERVERAPAAQRERSYVQRAPEAARGRPVEAPRRPAPASRRAAPAEKRDTHDEHR